MSTEIRVEGDVVIIDPGDRLTVETAAPFTETVCGLIETGYTRLVLNMANVRSIDASGLGVITRALVAARAGGGELKLMNLTPRSRHVLTITGLLTAVGCYDCEAEAIVSFSMNRHAPWAEADGMSCGVFAV